MNLNLSLCLILSLSLKVEMIFTYRTLGTQVSSNRELQIERSETSLFKIDNKSEVISKRFIRSNFIVPICKQCRWRLIYYSAHDISAELASDIKSIIGNVVDNVKRELQ